MTSSSKRFEPLTPPKNLTGALVARLTEEITSGRLKPNEKLPTEQQMISTFGVSRTVIREAIAALRSEGLVESRQGAGVFVTSDLRKRPFRIDPDGLRTIKGVVDVMELRIAVEIEAAGLAAERRQASDLTRIRNSLTAFEEAVEKGEDAVEADYQFHLAISRATQNSYYGSFIEFLGRHIIPRRSVHIGAQDEAGQNQYLTKVLAEHRAILKAIELGDAKAANRAMRKHLEEGRSRYLAFAEK